MPAAVPPADPATRASRLATLLSVAAALVWIPQAFLLAVALGRALDAETTDPVAAMLWPVAGFLALALLRAGLDAAAHLAATGTAIDAKVALRRRIAATVARWSPADSLRPPAGEIANLAADQIEAIEPYIVRYAPARTRMMVVPLAILAVTFTISWAAGLLLLLAGPIIPVFMSLIGAAARERSERQLGEIGGLTGVLLDRLSGLETLRLFGAVEASARAIADAGERIRSRTMSVLALAFLSSAVLEIFAAIGVGLIAVWVGFSLIGWIDFGTTLWPLTATSGLFVLLLAPEYFQPLRDFAAAYHDKASADAARARVADLVDAPRLSILGSVEGTAGRPARAAPPAVTVTALAVRGATDRAEMLASFDLDVAAGECIAVLGPSGTGKSTLLAAIAGLAPAAGGEIRIDGEAMTADIAQRLRRRMAWVGQDSALFQGSLAANLRFAAAPDVAAAAIDDALALAACGFVGRLPNGLATRIGADGSGLSGGEARRIALARAALGDADLLLADEPTAHLDAETAALVREGLLRLARGRTVIIATHDRTLAALADRVVEIGAPGEPPLAARSALEEPA
ncbi:thiol reductant ABC exporter subunit CydD [Methylobrevis albus]|uniref:Thiol reductant ABC exporter subunit CydD n=1 Tax=Methylobrevis albus TaxID=2793297 RepID=A0A931I0Z3_9HYPH|nr:thiol reductant ABC exporter subunit CydD [Methylobrevis albus]MBH0238322.1 thiol reductant ABC exporter subunit CydD [Methylobrevis albus]